jgi:type IV pilus assembly protein PilW
MKSMKKQAGATLVELMIGLALSLIVTTSMVALMGNSLGSTTRVIQMTQLTDEMRNAMSMITRDTRRANYSAHAIYCYANTDCGADGSTKFEPIVFENDTCLTFNVDRDQDNFGTSAPGGFRLADRDGVGFIEMWVGGDGLDCGDAFDSGADNWLALTDPEFVDITIFSVVTSELVETVPFEDGSEINQQVNQVKFEMVGELILDANITRRIEDTIRVRNDYVFQSTPPAI